MNFHECNLEILIINNLIIYSFDSQVIKIKMESSAKNTRLGIIRCFLYHDNSNNYTVLELES